MNKLSEKGFTVVEGLLIVLAVLLLGFGGYYVWNENQNSESDDNDSLTTSEQDLTTNNISSENENITLSSKLYPGVVFNAYEGWELSELPDYDSGVSATVSLSKANAKVDLSFNTSADRGIAWPECFIEDTDEYLGYTIPASYSDKGVFSRYEKEGKYSYGFVDTEINDSYKEIADLSGYLIADVSYCAKNGVIATVNSTKSITDMPNSHDKDNDGLVDAWLEGIVTNTLTMEESILKEMDTIIAEFVTGTYQ